MNPKTDPSYLDYKFELTKPEGLNYDGDGTLWAVYYYLGPSPVDKTSFNPLACFPKNYGFDPTVHPHCANGGGGHGGDGNEAHWHTHDGALLLGLDYDNPAASSKDVYFDQGLGLINSFYCATNPGNVNLEKCTNEKPFATYRWNPRFHMLHVWLHGPINPCGVFANTHPHLKGDITDEHVQPASFSELYDLEQYIPAVLSGYPPKGYPVIDPTAGESLNPAFFPFDNNCDPTADGNLSKCTTFVCDKKTEYFGKYVAATDPQLKLQYGGVFQAYQGYCHTFTHLGGGSH